MTRPTFPTEPLYARNPISPLRAAREARDEALARVESHSRLWRHFADEALRRVAMANRVVTSDLVWQELEAMRIPPPPEPRAMGVVVKAGIKAGIIEPLGFTTGSNPKHHADIQRTFRSLVAR